MKATITAGFTLVELAVVILLLGILAIAVVPRLTGSQAFSEASYQARLVSALRHTQIMAMQDTDPAHCYQLNLLSGGQSAFAPPVGMPNSCSGVPDFALADAGIHSSTNQTEMQLAGVSLLAAASNGSSISDIRFDNLGRASNCTNGCQLAIRGQRVRYVCVTAQGYIRASDQVCP